MLRSHTTLPHTALTLLLAAPLSCAPAEQEGQVSDPQGCRTVVLPADSTTSSSGQSGTSSSGSGDDTRSSATSTAETTSADASSATSSTTGPASGQGTFPDETGLEAFCRRYVECGGTAYDAQSCVDASFEYWGSCPSRVAALNVYGSCMAELSCDDWSPDTYDPNSTVCAQQWADLGNSAPCVAGGATSVGPTDR